MTRWVWRLAPLALALAACDGGSAADAGPPADAGSDVDAGPSYSPACDNVDPTHCLLPWPSDHFRVDGRIAVPREGLPPDARGRRVDPSFLPDRDGFDLLPTILTVLRPAPDVASLDGEDAIEASLGPDAKVVLVDVETGERVPCWAELDAWPDVDPDEVPLYVRPAVRLRPGARYVVGIRGLVDAEGEPIEPSDFFAALRDETPLEGSDVESRRAGFAETFSALAEAGLPRAALQAAWGFTTATEDSVTRDLTTMRDGLVAGSASPCTIETIEQGEDVPDGIWIRAHGTLRVPLYLVGADPTSVEEAHLARGADGLPVTGGDVDVPFLVLVPESVRAQVAGGGAPGRAVVYGHGILGSRDETAADFMTTHASELRTVVFATDWWGMSDADLARVVRALSEDFSYFRATTERLHQGVLHVLALLRAARQTCAAVPELAVPLDAGGSAPAYDPATLAYYGNSQGSILGAVVAGLAPETERFVLGVGGAGWPMIIKRSDAWRGFGAVLAQTYERPLDRSVLVAMVGLLFAPVDGITYAPHLLADPLPGAVARRVLVQIGIGDVAVSNRTAHVHARSASIPLTLPSPVEPFGIEAITPPAESGLTIFAIDGVDPLPPGSRDPGASPTHNAVRALPAARAQIDAFLGPTPSVVHPCDGPCDPD